MLVRELEAEMRHRYFLTFITAALLTGLSPSPASASHSLASTLHSPASASPPPASASIFDTVWNVGKGTWDAAFEDDAEFCKAVKTGMTISTGAGRWWHSCDPSDSSQRENVASKKVSARPADEIDLTRPIRIFFDYQQATLDRTAKHLMLMILPTLRAHHWAHIRVRGHADLTERAAAQLSQARAQGVRAWLIDAGIEPSQIDIDVRGIDDVPIPVDGARFDQPVNRRAEIEFTPAPAID